MSEKTQQIIELVRIKSWFVPKDVDTYRMLRGLKMPLLKIHRDTLPLLKLVTGPRGIRARSTDFSTILEERLDKIGSQWKSKPGRTCKLTDSRLLFAAASTDSNRRAIAALESSFDKFCRRWGHKVTPVYSERDDRLRLVIDYAFDPSRNPIVESEPVETSRQFEFELGSTKLRLTFMDKPTSAQGGRNMPPIILFEAYAKAGSEWKLAHTGTCVDPEIGDPTQLMTAISLLVDRRQGAETGAAYQPWFPVPDQTRSELIEELRTLTIDAETSLFKLAFAPQGHKDATTWMNTLWSAGRKVPRLAAKLKAAGMELDLTRVKLLAHLNNTRCLYPFFLHREMGYLMPTVEVEGRTVQKDLSPAEIDAMSQEMWPRLLRIKAAWLAAAGMSQEAGAAAFKVACTEVPGPPSVAEH